MAVIKAAMLSAATPRHGSGCKRDAAAAGDWARKAVMGNTQVMGLNQGRRVTERKAGSRRVEPLAERDTGEKTVEVERFEDDAGRQSLELIGLTLHQRGVRGADQDRNLRRASP